MPMPEYHVSIERLDTEQRVFVGVFRGALAPLLESIILDNARTTDAGLPLSDEQTREAYRHAC